MNSNDNIWVYVLLAVTVYFIYTSYTSHVETVAALKEGYVQCPDPKNSHNSLWKKSCN